MPKGKLIVIEAGDGSGKATQTDALLKHLQGDGLNAKKISFPDYESDSSALIKMYLAGKFGATAADVNAYAASLFYAADRFASYRMKWQAHYENGGIVVADRYTFSNMAHQSIKTADKNEREKFFAWLWDLEFEKLALPVPDAVIFLDMPPEIAMKLIAKRNAGQDIHERDADHLTKTYFAYRELAERCGWHTVPCADGENARPVAAIHDEVYAKVKMIL